MFLTSIELLIDERTISQSVLIITNMPLVLDVYRYVVYKEDTRVFDANKIM